MRGPPPFVACTTAQRAGGCAPCRGPAGPRGRVPVWPLSAARVGPRAAMRGGCPHTLQGMRKKCRTAGPAGRPAPLRGRASRWPLGGFFARPATARISPSPRCVVLAFGFLGFTPSRACRAPGNAGGQGDARFGALPPLGWFPAPLLCPPAFPWPSVSPFSPCRWWLSAPAPAWGASVGRARRPCGRQRYTEGAKAGRNERRKERPRRGRIPPALGLVPCASSFAIETVRPCHRSGRRTNTRGQGIRRRGTGAPPEP